MKSLSTKFALFLGLIVFWPAPCWTMQEKAPPDTANFQCVRRAACRLAGHDESVLCRSQR